MKSKHTEGEVESGIQEVKGLGRCLVVAQKSYILEKRAICIISPESLVDSTDKANAEFIVDAFNTSLACDLLPSEILAGSDYILRLGIESVEELKKERDELSKQLETGANQYAIAVVQRDELLEVLKELTYQLTGEQEAEDELEKSLGITLCMRVMRAKQAIKSCSATKTNEKP